MNEMLLKGTSATVDRIADESTVSFHVKSCVVSFFLGLLTVLGLPFVHEEEAKPSSSFDALRHRKTSGLRPRRRAILHGCWKTPSFRMASVPFCKPSCRRGATTDGLHSVAGESPKGVGITLSHISCPPVGSAGLSEWETPTHGEIPAADSKMKVEFNWGRPAGGRIQEHGHQPFGLRASSAPCPPGDCYRSSSSG
jgi:hypothetical protein